MAKQTNYSPTFPMFPGGATTFTKSDTVNLPTPSVIYVGGAGSTGTVRVITAQGDDAGLVKLSHRKHSLLTAGQAGGHVGINLGAHLVQRHARPQGVGAGHA